MSYLSKQYKKARRAISGAATSSGVSFTVPKIPSITDIKNMIAKGPTGGVPKQVADKLYGGSTKAAVENVQRTYKKAEKKVRETLLPSASLPSLPTGILGDDDDDDTPLPEFTYGICCNCNEVTGYCTCMHETVPQGEVPPCELDVAYDWTFYSAEDICGDGNVSDENPFCCLDPLSQPCPWCSEGQSICDNLHGGGGGTPLFGGGGARSITNSHLRRMIKDPANPFLTNRKKKKK